MKLISDFIQEKLKINSKSKINNNSIQDLYCLVHPKEVSDTFNKFMDDYEDAFIWLDDAKIVHTAFNSTDPNVGLNLNTDRLTLKCYLNDTGLLISHTFSENDLMDEDVYKSILFGKLNLNEGMFMENVVSQMLRSS